MNMRIDTRIKFVTPENALWTLGLQDMAANWSFEEVEAVYAALLLWHATHRSPMPILVYVSVFQQQVREWLIVYVSERPLARTFRPYRAVKADFDRIAAHYQQRLECSYAIEAQFVQYFLDKGFNWLDAGVIGKEQREKYMDQFSGLWETRVAAWHELVNHPDYYDAISKAVQEMNRTRHNP